MEKHPDPDTVFTQEGTFTIFGICCSALLTSDKDVGGVGLVPGLGGDAQGVETLVLLVEVGEGQRGLVSAPVHLVPFGRRQQHVCGAERQDLDSLSPVWGKLLKEGTQGILTVSVPLHLWLVAVQCRVDDHRAAQTHGLALPSEGHAKLIDDVSLEGDAVLGHRAVCRQLEHPDGRF